MFNSLSDRLTATFKNLKGKGRLTEADVDATVREIRRALLDADVAVPVVREFTAAVKERALGLEVSEALNPGQQVVKIVNEELQNILGGQTRRIRMAKTGPTIIMLAGLQGAGKTTLAGKLGKWLKGQGHRPLLVASDLQRPNAVTQLKVVGERAGVPVFAPHPGTTSEFDDPTGDPVQVARDGARRLTLDVLPAADAVALLAVARRPLDPRIRLSIRARRRFGLLTVSRFRVRRSTSCGHGLSRRCWHRILTTTTSRPALAMR